MVDYGNTKTPSTHRRLGNSTVAAGFHQGKQPKFSMGKIPMGQYSCKKEEEKIASLLVDHGAIPVVDYVEGAIPVVVHAWKLPFCGVDHVEIAVPVVDMWEQPPQWLFMHGNCISLGLIM